VTAIAEVGLGVWRLTAAETYVATRSDIDRSGGWRHAPLPNSTVRVGDLNWDVTKDVEGRVVCWTRTINGIQHLILNNPKETEMTKTKRDHGTAVEPKPVTYTLPEPVAEAPKAEVKAPRTPKPVEFSAEKEARAVGQDTKVGALLATLAQGATMEQLVEVLSKSGSPANPSVVRSWLTYDVRKAGYGLRQDGNLFYLVFPEGMTKVAYKQATPKATEGKAPETPALKVERGSKGAKIAAMKKERSKKAKAK